MVGQVSLSELEGKILLTALSGQRDGQEAMEFQPYETEAPEQCRKALAGLVLRDLLTWTGTHTYVLTDEGAVTAAALMTRISA